MSRTYLRGDLYYADLGHGIGSEQKGTRPVVIIQNNVGNKHSPTVIIAAVTSKANVKAKLPTHYYLDAGNGLAQPSLVLLEQIRTVDKQRLSSYIGRLDKKHIQGINRQIANDNKLLKELKARITRIYNWSKEQAAVEAPQDGDSLVARLYEAQAKVNQDKARSRSGKIKALQENAKLLAFLQGNGINSMQELYEKVAAMNKDYYDLRGKIVKAERRLAVLDERLEMWAQYEQYKPIRQKLDKAKPGKREKYQQEHSAELALFDAAAVFLKSLKESGEAITPKAWRAEAAKLAVQKDADYQKMRAMRDEIKAVESLRKAADRLAREGQHQQKENER